MINLIQFRRRNNGWDGIKRENFSLLVDWIKKGEIDAIASDTVTVEETMIIKKQGFALIPDVFIPGIKASAILKIQIEK